jgi:hypothetical protein
MSNAREQAHPGTNRRTLLKRFALGLAAIGAYAALTRRPLGGIKRRGRSIPAELPGEGSIFQPRNDRRSRRP